MCKENIAKGPWNKLDNFQTKGIALCISIVHQAFLLLLLNFLIKSVSA